MLKQISGAILALFLLSTASTLYAAEATQWQDVAPGLKYTALKPQLDNPSAILHAFQIDLRLYQLDLASASDYGNITSYVSELAKDQNAWLAVNGGFFTPFYRPIGLRINEGKVITPLKNISWWGIFYIEKGQAKISSQWEFHQARGIDFALQSGPRLLVNGRTPKLKPGFEQRSAIGITKEGKVIICVTENLALSTSNLSEIMGKKESLGGLNCYNALNLDGGTSSQLYAKVENFCVKVQSLRAVADGITVKPKNYTR